MMKRLLLALVLACALSAPAWAGFDEGLAAYERGDYETALREWSPLAEQGIPVAQFFLGTMYAIGRGVAQDYVQAHLWLNLAVSRLPPGESRNVMDQVRDNIEEHMTPAQVAEAQKFALEWRPKAQAKN